MKFSIKNFFSKCDQIGSLLTNFSPIWKRRNAINRMIFGLWPYFDQFSMKFAIVKIYMSRNYN